MAHRLELVDRTKGNEKIVTIEETVELRQKEGAYYTPPHIVRLILSQTLEPKVKSILEEAKVLIFQQNFEDAKKTIQQIDSIKVLDPACGSGSFLIEAFRILVLHYQEYNHLIAQEFSKLPFQYNRTLDFQIEKETEHVLLENLYGVDVDSKAVEVTKSNLWLHHIDYNRNDYQYTGGKVKKKLPPLSTSTSKLAIRS